MTNSEKLVGLAKRWRPKFGDASSIQIRNMFKQLDVARTHVASHGKRVRSLSNAIAKKNRYEEEVDRLESSLVSELERLSPVSPKI